MQGANRAAASDNKNKDACVVATRKKGVSRSRAFQTAGQLSVALSHVPRGALKPLVESPCDDS